LGGGRQVTSPGGEDEGSKLIVCGISPQRANSLGTPESHRRQQKTGEALASPVDCLE
jgi:hypothetical protein